MRPALFLLALALLGPVAALAAEPPPGEGPWVVSVRYATRAELDRLTAEFEPWSVDHVAGRALLDVGQAGWGRLAQLGFEPVVDARRTAAATAPRGLLPGQVAGIPGYPCYRTVEETFAAAQALVAAHPTLASWIDVGDSWDKQRAGGPAGYDLMVLALTSSATPGPKPRLLVNAAIHAREYVTAETATRFAEHLLAGYGSDPDLTWLLDHQEVHLLLHDNPDGRKRAEAGSLWRKNTDSDWCTTPASQGIDLNRNFPYQWGCCGGSSGNGCSETYRGPAPVSEPEALALRNYMTSIFPDYGDPAVGPIPGDAAGLFVDLHSYGELVMWPWGYTPAAAPNATALRTLGRKLAYFNGHTPYQANNLYTTDGSTRDFIYGQLGVASYTIEMGDDFFQDCATFEATIHPTNRAALLYAARVARAPYQLPAGPEALTPAATPNAITAGQPVTVTATLDDTRFGGSGEPVQAVAAAEVYVDVPPWGGSDGGLALQASDGALDEPVEPVQGVLSTAGWTTGRHTLFVRGRDAAANWGPVSAVFVDVAIPVELESFGIE